MSQRTWLYYCICFAVNIGISSNVIAQQKAYQIEGHANGLNGNKLILNIPDTTGVYQKDTCLITNNRFDYSGKIPHSVLCFLEMPDDSTALESRQFFIDTGKALVEITKTYFESPKISGSKTDSLFQQYFIRKNNLNIEIKNKRNLLQERGLSDSLIDSLLSQDYLSVMQLAMDVVKANTNNVLSAYLLRYYMDDINDVTLASFFNSLDATIKATFYGKMIEKRIQVSSGGVAPLFDGFTIDNVYYSLEKNIKDGKVILLMFWASWCKPCREEMPYFLNMLSKYSHNGFEIVAIANERSSIDTWKQAIEKDHSKPFIHLLQRTTIPKDAGEMYSVMPIPTIILIDRKGIIKYRKTGGPYTGLEDILLSCFNY